MIPRSRTFAITASALSLVLAAGCSPAEDEDSVASGAETTVDESPPEASTTAAAPEPSGPVATPGFTKYEVGDETWASVGIVVASSTTSGPVELNVTLLDAAGSPVATEAGHVGASVPMGDVFAAVTFTGSDVGAAESVLVDVADAPGSMAADPLTVIVKRFGFDAATGRFELGGTVSNPTDEPVESARIQCVAFAAALPVAGFSAVTDTIGPGATIAWAASDAFDPAAEEVYCSGTA